MSEFEKKAPPYRLATIHHDDTLQKIAQREMGDANRWPELVWLNSLTHPYVTDDPQRVVPGVLLSGSKIKVPAPVGVYAPKDDTARVFGRDIKLENGKLSSLDGDLALVSGVDNLRQQFSNALSTGRGRLIRHPMYGCMIWRLLGTKNSVIAGRLGASYVKATLLSDYRVSAVTKVTATISGDVVNIVATAKAIDGSMVDVIVKPVKEIPPTLPFEPAKASGWSYDYGNNWGY